MKEKKDIEKIKIRILNWVMILLLISSFFLLVKISMSIRSEGAQCIIDPIKYYNELGNDKCMVTCFSGIEKKRFNFYNSDVINFTINKNNIITPAALPQNNNYS